MPEAAQIIFDVLSTGEAASEPIDFEQQQKLKLQDV